MEKALQVIAQYAGSEKCHRPWHVTTSGTHIQSSCYWNTEKEDVHRAVIDGSSEYTGGLASNNQRRRAQKPTTASHWQSSDS